MKQRIIRTYKGSDSSNVRTVNEYLNEGWKVIIVTPIGDSLEYVLQIDGNFKKCDSQSISKNTSL
jgi:hypothetical protein